MKNEKWYAVCFGRDDSDLGTGSTVKREAMRYANFKARSTRNTEDEKYRVSIIVCINGFPEDEIIVREGC